jgi:excisionase family DNA binding protein
MTQCELKRRPRLTKRITVVSGGWHCSSKTARRQDGKTARRQDGKTVEFPAQLSRFLESVTRSAANGSVIFTSSLPEELTTTAAEQLGVSRPPLMKMMSAGEIPATKVKAHTRLRGDDVLDLRQRREERRREAADKLLRAGEAFD